MENKKKQYALYLAFGALLLVLLILQRQYLLNWINTKLDSELAENDKFWRQRQRIYYLHSGYIKVPGKNTILTDINGEKLLLKDVFSNRSGVLVYRFTFRMCFDCIKDELERLNNLYKILGKGSIVILTGYNGIYNLKVIVKSIKTSIPCYNLPFGEVGAGVEGLDMPYLFYVEPGTFAGSLLFFPEKAKPELSEQYYEDVIDHRRRIEVQKPIDSVLLKLEKNRSEIAI